MRGDGDGVAVRRRLLGGADGNQVQALAIQNGEREDADVASQETAQDGDK